MAQTFKKVIFDNKHRQNFWKQNLYHKLTKMGTRVLPTQNILYNRV